MRHKDHKAIKVVFPVKAGFLSGNPDAGKAVSHPQVEKINDSVVIGIGYKHEPTH